MTACHTREAENRRVDLRQCPHGYHHPYPLDLDYPHSCDGCWCEGERDRRDYGWPHTTNPPERNQS